MASKDPNLIDGINEAQQRITELFVRQCTYGAQTRRLPSGFASCGQFIGSDAETIEQFGLHGISAALRVLGPCQTSECRSIVNKIVAYCEASFGVNASSQVTSGLDLKQEDKQNVIKLGELLYGLSFVTTGQAERDRLVSRIAERLKSSLRNDKGWGYFLEDSKPELLPTAYAVRGLAKNGYDTNGPQRFLLESLDARKQSAATSPVDLTTAVACAYCLTFSRDTTSEHSSILKDTFSSVWRALEPLFGENIEQNVEYWHGTETAYVRIPFQLYLLALAAEYSLWRFAGFHAQRLLRAVVNALKTGSFKYPYSGDRLSSRTNSIAYDVLGLIREGIRRVTWLRIAYFIDRVRVFFGSRAFRVIAALLAFGFVLYAVQGWMKTGRVSDLAPELLSSLVMLLLTFGRRH